MAATPSKSFQTPSSPKLRSKSNRKSSPAETPDTPQTLHIRRSTRAKSLLFDAPKPPRTPLQISLTTPKRRTRRSIVEEDSAEDKATTSNVLPKNKDPVVDASKKNGKISIQVSFAPVTPASSEKTSTRKRAGDGGVVTTPKRGKNAQSTSHHLAANLHKGLGLPKIDTKTIPQHVRSHKQTDLERAKATLSLAWLPESLPCRNKEMEEITTFIKGAICNDQCLGRCLYIHGVPGTGKTISVLSVMRSLKSEVDAGNIKPYSFVEINGMKLASPENIYKVIYEALNGHRVSWKKALHLLNERFVEGKKTRDEADQPCILLIDELDLLVTRKQTVLYNIFDWSTKPHSKLVVIGIANTMDLLEKLHPRISSRMGIQRLCFGPYNYQQLQEIISSRLKGIDVFEEQVVEYASRKVAAISGDARRALEICRHAVEMADYRIKTTGVTACI